MARNKAQPVSIRPIRASFRAVITGAQATDLAVPITDTKQFAYDSASPPLADTGNDISGFYQTYAIQSTTTNGKNAQVQIRLVNGDEWVAPPTSYTSDEAGAASPGLIAPGELFFMRLPVPGVRVRLLVTQPVIATDFSVLVTMAELTTRPVR